MRLAAGTTLGPYVVLAPLGAGGMGEVYRGRDTRLGREVAIKVLPADCFADPIRRRRFVREARAASALNHPNIVTIHEIESADGIDFMVMELVSGGTLAELIRRRLELREALRIAIPIAEALARAHAAGIVHRDLKPGNVMVADDGVVKVLDFGLAKLIVGDGQDVDAATETAEELPVSGSGVITGTAGYMSPEQASGGSVDERSDIFSFGAMLYEMVTGRRAFSGNSTAETLQAVIRVEPPSAGTLVAGLPKELEKLIERCLRKEPQRRFQHIDDVAVVLKEVADEMSAAPAALVNRRRWAWRPFAVATMLTLAMLGALWRAGRREVQPAYVVPVTATRGIENWPTFSPEGDQIAFSWEGENADDAGASRHIWLKLIGSSGVRQLTTEAGDDEFPSWSPDGRQIAFVRRRPDGPAAIYLVSPLGGPARRLGDFRVTEYSQLSWSPDSRSIAASRARQPGDGPAEGGGIYLVPVDGKEPLALTRPVQPGFDNHPALSPDGRHLAYAACPTDFVPPCHVEVLDLDANLARSGGKRRLTLRPGGVHGIAWTRDSQSVIFGGSPLYIAGLGSRLWRAPLRGDRPPERIEVTPAGAFTPAAARSRDRLAFTQDRGDIDIFRFQEGRAHVPVVASSFVDYLPAFSPDGRRIAFESSRSGDVQEIWLTDADGARPEQLTHGPGSWQGNPRWSPDGRRIAFSSRGEDGYADVWTIDVEGGPPQHGTHGPRNEAVCAWSHDGRWIYYREDRPDGRDIARVPAGGGVSERVTRGGGFLGRLSPDGKTLFYTKGASLGLFRLSLEGGEERKVVECVERYSLADGPDGMYYIGCASERDPAPLYRLDVATNGSQLLGHVERPMLGVAVSPDGKTILYARRVTDGADLAMIENFR